METMAKLKGMGFDFDEEDVIEEAMKQVTIEIVDEHGKRHEFR